MGMFEYRSHTTVLSEPLELSSSSYTCFLSSIWVPGEKANVMNTQDVLGDPKQPTDKNTGALVGSESHYLCENFSAFKNVQHATAFRTDGIRVLRALVRREFVSLFQPKTACL